MIRIVHFDRDLVVSKKIRADLEREFGKHSDVLYTFYKDPQFHTFLGIREDLENFLPLENVLLIHPGEQNTPIIFNEYPQRFPNLRIALVVPGRFNSYEQKNGVKLFSYEQVEPIVNFALGK